MSKPSTPTLPRSAADKAAYRGPREYLVWASTAKMPSKCWGSYLRVALLEVLPGTTHVRMISPRAEGVLRVVETWERCRTGTTDRCASARARAAAEDLAARLRHDAVYAPLVKDVLAATAAVAKLDAEKNLSEAV